MSVSVQSARHEWEESDRRLAEAARDRDRYERLLAQVDAVTAELRRRIGETFTLAQLAELYVGADRWSRDAVETVAPAPGWAGTLSLVEGAAFHRYARGALDYTP